MATRAAAARHFTTAFYTFNTIISNENYLTTWAFVEAAHFAIQFNSKIKSFYQRKKAKTKVVGVIKAVKEAFKFVLSSEGCRLKKRTDGDGTRIL